MSILSGGVEIKEPITIGKEFIEWAEQYWKIDELLQMKDPDTFAGEVCDYNYMREIFIKKIDAIIKDRLELD